MSNHSVIEHRSNYHYVRIEEDFLAICSRGECAPHCKALILAILEHWSNSKKDKSDYIYMTMPQWIKYTYMLYERNVITDCIAELLKEKLIERQPILLCGQKTFEYRLCRNTVQEQIRQLPEKGDEEVLPRLDAYLAYKENAKARRESAKKLEAEQEEVGDKSRTSHDVQVREKSRKVGDKSPEVREKSTARYVKNQPILDSITQIPTDSPQIEGRGADRTHVNSLAASQSAQSVGNTQDTLTPSENIRHDGITDTPFNAQETSERRIASEATNITTLFPDMPTLPSAEDQVKEATPKETGKTAQQNSTPKKSRYQITLQGQRIFDLYQQCKKRRLTLNEGNVRAANSLAEVVAQDQDLLDVVKAMEDDDYYKAHGMDLATVFRRYDVYFDKVCSNRRARGSGQTRTRASTPESQYIVDAIEAATDAAFAAFTG